MTPETRNYQTGVVTPDMLLEIVVAPDCFGCDQAREIAVELRRRLPWLEVDLIELDGRRPVPRNVVATPTYLLDGSVMSLGNPTLEMAIREITQRQERRDTGSRRETSAEANGGGRSPG